MPNKFYKFAAHGSLVLSFLSLPSLAHAVDLSFSGFGTLGYAYENQDELAFRRDITRTTDIDTDGSFRVDSNIGMQFDAVFNRDWSFTTQFLFDQGVTYDLDELTELAFIRYSPNASWDFRAGRIGVSAYAAADSRHIDYAHLWVRPPQELYGGIVFNSLDGIGATYYSNNAYFNWKASLEYGRNQEVGEVPLSNEEYSTDLDNVVSLSFEVDKNEWKWQLSYARVGSLTVNQTGQTELLQNSVDQFANNPGVAAFFPAISAEALRTRDALVVENEQIHYFQAAALYFDGLWTFQTELFNIDAVQDSIPQGYGGYALVGRTFDSLTPYAIYGRFKPSSSPFQQDEDWSQAGAQAAQLQGATEAAINSVRIDQESYSVGLRWDVSPYIALKAQYDHVKINPYGYGLWASTLETMGSSSRVHLFSLNMNFIF
ncbi:hypothetical protein [Vibrio sinaloensis]|uniref:hypothetical protein n=1 Tax=Photobacterium sp. (strain ATCC 43367) TaxID=379097 RepID=UPI0009079C77|nr:hypothetical protein [Vibrio sinaloensis]